MVIKCHARCGNKKIIVSTCNVGEVMKLTGYKVTFSDGDIVYYCPECYTKAQELAYGLLSVLGDKHVIWKFLFPREPYVDNTIVTTCKKVKDPQPLTELVG